MRTYAGIALSKATLFFLAISQLLLVSQSKQFQTLPAEIICPKIHQSNDVEVYWQHRKSFSGHGYAKTRGITKREESPHTADEVNRRYASERLSNILDFCRGGSIEIDEGSDSDYVDDDEDKSDDEDITATEEDESIDSDGNDDAAQENADQREDEESGDLDNEGSNSDNYSDDEEEPKPKRKNKYAKKRSPSVLEAGANSLSIAAAAAFKLTKGGMKLAVDLVSAKHVSAIQIVGKWRMDQEVQIGKGATITCPATLEFTEDGKVITSFEGKTFTSDYKFTERPWPRKCSIHFEAAAFQGPGDKEPNSMFYKGYFKKSIMNPNVILIRGRVYKLLGKLFWKQQKKCGTFKATQKRYR